MPIIKGIVVSLKANYMEVEIDLKKYITSSDGSNKNNRFLCTRRRSLEYKDSLIYVGDNVELEAVDWKHYRAAIKSVDNRTNFFSRPPVANISHIFIVISLDRPKLDYRQVNNFLLTAEQSSVDVSIILTKSDLIEKNFVKEQAYRFQEWGYNSIITSVVDGKGIQDLIDKLKSSKLSLLCGPSGVGKTSLLKYILPDQSLRIGKLSKKLLRGTNTTRHVELFSIDQGARVADTPGFNRSEILVNPRNFPNLFPELRIQLENFPCKFRDCLHRDEPGCGISKSWERYSLYRKQLDEMINSYRSFQVD